MMLRISNFRWSLLAGSTMNCRCSLLRVGPKTSQHSLRIQRVSFFAPSRLASSFSRQNQDLIYTGVMANKIWLIKVITLATSVTSVPIQLYLLKTNEQVMSSIPYQILLYIFITFQMLMPFIIHYVGKRYVVRMYHNAITDKYTVETYNVIPTIKYITFRPSEIRPPKVEVFATAVIREKIPVFFDPAYFTDIEHYKRLLGYDKPINFSDEDEESTESTSTNSKEVKDKERPS